MSKETLLKILNNLDNDIYNALVGLNKEEVDEYYKIVDKVLDEQPINPNDYNNDQVINFYVEKEIQNMLRKNNVGGSRHRKSHKHRKSTKKGIKKHSRRAHAGRTKGKGKSKGKKRSARTHRNRRHH